MWSHNIEKLFIILSIAIISFAIASISFIYLDSQGFFSSDSAGTKQILSGGAAGFVIIFSVVYGAYRLSEKRHPAETAVFMAELVCEKIFREINENYHEDKVKNMIMTKYNDYLKDVFDTYSREGKYWRNEFKKQLTHKVKNAFIEKFNEPIELSKVEEFSQFSEIPNTK